MENTSRPRLFSHLRQLFAGVSFFAMLSLASTVWGQTISDNFNDGDDTTPPNTWTHYAPLQPPPFNEVVTWTFPNDPDGGFYYRIFGAAPDHPHDPATGAETGPARVGSFRNDATYTDFFAAVDIVNFDATVPQNTAFIAARITTPGLGTTFGYLVAYAVSLENEDQQGTFAIAKTESELSVSVPNQFTGGGALVSRLNPAGKHRMVFTGTGANLRSTIYERTDLLEPIVKIGASDGDLPNGTSGIGAVNFDGYGDKPTDFTFDNYYSSAAPTAPVGVPGTPQVINLVPAPQTLFYTIPGSDRITFTATSFGSNQIATNMLKLSLNDVDVDPSQLTFTPVTNLFGSPNTNFTVRYTGPLTSNTIYNGKITVLNPAGKGTTNRWVFDTFVTNGALIVEAEDYNYGNGSFQDNPPVSGLDPVGGTVNGGGTGYYGLTGTPDVDFHDTDTDTAPGRNPERHQYRPGDGATVGPDGVGTFQNLYVGDTPRPNHVATNVPDYALWRMQAGEWVNYTRTFPNTNWNVYLRASSQARQDVRFDEVTGDRTTTNQAKVLRGEFLLPNTGSSTRFRYVPLTDAAGNPRVLNLAGIKTLRMTPLGGFDSDRQHGGDDFGSFQPTYFLFLPTSNPVSQLPWIASASPSAGAVDVSVQPTLQIIVLNGTTAVNTGSVQLRFDGSDVTSSATITGTTSEGAGATISYAPPGFLQPNSTHTVSLVFADNGVPTVQSNQWSFTTANLPVIPAVFALTSCASTNFTIQIHKAPNDSNNENIARSSYRAERQLANELINPETLQPFTNEAANTATNYGFYTETNAINYEQAGISSGFFGGDTRFPGIPQNLDTYGDDPNYIAMAASIKLPLAPGLYRMGVASDEGFKVTTGTNATSTDLILGRFEGGRGHSQTAFDFIVATNGVYNFRLVYYERDGGASCEWYWINLTNGVRTLVTPTPGVQLFSATAVTGPYTFDVSAVIDTVAKTATVPKSGSTRFYRLSACSPLNITNITLSGGNVVLKYQ